MAETTQDQEVENQRFLQNTEQQQRNVEDEQLIQDIAEFIQLSAESVLNPNLASNLKDLSNQLVANKSELASTPGEDGEIPMSPEEALAQQGGLQGGGLPPEAGMGGGGEIPPEVAMALAQQQGGGLPPI